MRKIKCILFDVDGVVVRAEMFSKQYARAKNISDDEMLSFFTDEFPCCVEGKADLKEVLKEWLSKWKWEGSVNEFLRAWFEAEHKIDERVIEVVEQLRNKGVKCYLATNQEKYRVKYMKEKMKFAEIFDGIFASSEIGCRKPNRQFYEFILRDLRGQCGIQSNEIIFFDDNQKNIDEAKAVGIEAYLYNDFSEFEKIIKKL